MDEELRQMLADAMVKEFENLEQLTPGSKEEAATVENIIKLYRTGLEEINNLEQSETQAEKLEMEKQIHEDELAKAKRAEKLQELKMAQDRRDKRIEHGISIVGILAPLALYRYWMAKGFKFEETGTITSTTFRSLIQKVKPTK